MVQLQADIEKIEAAGIQVVAVSYDSVDILKKYAETAGITYPLLSDEGSATIKAYGILNTDMKEGTRLYGIPYPGTYMLDKEGVVRAKLFLDGYRMRHTSDELIAAAAKID